MTKARSNAVANAAKGDLTVGTGTNLSGILPVSATNGDTIVADASTATGLRYTAGTVQANPVLNSAYQIWQRGTNFTGLSGYQYCADRWSYYRDSSASGITVSRQTTSDTTTLPFIQYCAKVQRDSGNTGTQALNIVQSLESVNSTLFAGKTVTVSFFARKGADFSSTSNSLSVALISGTGTDQNLFNGFTGSTLVVSSGKTLTATWQRFTHSGSINSTATQLAILFQNAPTGTAGANDYFEVTGVQIDIGSVALPFRTYAGTIQGELAACQRYYYNSMGQNQIVGINTNTTTTILTARPPVTMRTTPTATLPTSGSIDSYQDGAKTSATAATSVYLSDSLAVFASVGYSGLTVGSTATWRSTTAFQLSAEL